MKVMSSAEDRGWCLLLACGESFSGGNLAGFDESWWFDRGSKDMRAELDACSYRHKERRISCRTGVLTERVS